MTCYCGESGYYHCSELRASLDEAKKLIKLIVGSGCLEGWNKDRPEEFSQDIYAECERVLSLPAEIQSFNEEDEHV
jgi:hypothetical protein